MTAPLILATERVDDMPRFLAQLERMGRQPLWDQDCPTPGTGVGLSLGWVSVLGLTHMRSDGDHRLNHVAPWATQRLHTRRPCTGPVVHPWDGGDDRLAPVLEAVSDERRWSALAGALTQHGRRVYDLEPACVRRESTTANGHWTVTADGWCPGGPRHDPRPARPQVKGMVSALDPRGLPVATDVGPGQRADAPVDVPAITRVREGVGRRGLLSVGDGPMAALESRAVLHAGGDDDWCPWSASHRPPTGWADSLAPVWPGEQAWTVLHRAPPGGTSARIAAGCERLEPVTAEVAGQPYRWPERRLVLRSCQLAPAGERGLRARLAQAQAAVRARNKRGRGPRRCPDPRALRQAVDTLLTRDRVHGRLHVRYQEPWWERPRRRDGRRDTPGRRE